MSANPDQAIPKKRPKGVPWRQDPVILRRLEQVEPLHLAGKRNVAIAALLHVDEQTIRADIKRLQMIWLERVGDGVELQRATIIAELANITRLALDAAAFDEACERAVLFDEPPPWHAPVVGVAAGDADHAEEPSGETAAEPSQATVGIVRRDDRGSAQFRGNKAAALGQARQAVMDRAKVLGLIVDKQAATDADGKDLPLEELMARYAAAHPIEHVPAEPTTPPAAEGANDAPGR